MLKFYSINPELDIDTDLNTFLEKQLIESSTIKASWVGNTQSENLLDIIIDRFNFFIESGILTCVDKKGINEVKFGNESCVIRTFNKAGTIVSEKIIVNNWDFSKYRILRYHLYNDLKEKLQDMDILDIDSLAIEYCIDKGFIIDFIYSFINKEHIEINTIENKTLLKIKSNIEQVLSKLDESINDMEVSLTP